MNIDNVLFKLKTLVDKKESAETINEKINELLNPVYYDAVVNTVDTNKLTNLKKEIKESRNKRLKIENKLEKISRISFTVLSIYILALVATMPFKLLIPELLIPLIGGFLFTLFMTICPIFATRKYLLNEINKNKEINNYYKEDVKEVSKNILQTINEIKNSEFQEEASYVKKYLLKNLKEYEEEIEKEKNFFVKLKYKIDEDFFNYSGRLENKKIKQIASEDEQLDNYYKTLISTPTKIK